MQFNIYLDDETGKRLVAATKASHQSRNALIREAIQLWLEKRENKKWPDEVLNFQGISDFPPFESARQELSAASDDPFS